MCIFEGVIGAVIVLTIKDIWEGMRRWLKEVSRRRKLFAEQKEKAHYCALPDKEKEACNMKPYHHGRVTRLREWLYMQIISFRQ